MFKLFAEGSLLTWAEIESGFKFTGSHDIDYIF